MWLQHAQEIRTHTKHHHIKKEDYRYKDINRLVLCAVCSRCRVIELGSRGDGGIVLGDVTRLHHSTSGA